MRSTMSQLVGRVRTLIADPAGGNQQFTDDQIEDQLDSFWRTEERWVPLRPVASFGAGGQALFFDYYSDVGSWESDVVLQNMAYTDITATADVAELLVGHWHFPAQPTGIGVRATGKTYDLYGGAADLLDMWAAQIKLDFDFRSGTDQFMRQQKFSMITNLATKYRALARPRSSTLYQSDVAPTEQGGGVTYPDLSGGGYGH